MRVTHGAVVAGWVATLAVVTAGCGSGGSAAANPALVATGARIVAGAGCEACHLIGDEGNDGPGPALTTVGAHLSRKAIERSLDDAREPMPSYGGPGGLPKHQLDAVVAYLASLRSSRDVVSVPGAPSYKQTTPPAKTLCSARYFATIVGILPGLSANRQAKQQLAEAELRLRRFCKTRAKNRH